MLAPGVAAPEPANLHGGGGQVDVLDGHGGGADLLPLGQSLVGNSLRQYQSTVNISHIFTHLPTFQDIFAIWCLEEFRGINSTLA